MATLDLDNTEIQTIVDHIATTMPWARANPLLMKITQQVQAQQQGGPGQQPMQARNGGDIRVGQE
jgi:hypothetical protein